MKVAILYYPMLFQRTGGLQVQVLETVRALHSLGVEAELFDYRKHRLVDFDLAHVFSAINGNHRIVQQARSDGLPVVLSTVLQPPWTRAKDRAATTISNCAVRLSGWSLSTTHQHVHEALTAAQSIVALGAHERKMLIRGYGVSPQRIDIVPNGVKRDFFCASDGAFRSRYGIDGPYALNVASVSPYKNQLSAVRALRGKIPLVVIGPCAAENRRYLDNVLKEGDGWVRYLGALDNDDPVLPSAFAGASLFVLLSAAEVQPISALEALAADCPVIITRHHSLDVLEDPTVLCEVDSDDQRAIERAVLDLLAAERTPGRFRKQVEQLTWLHVGHQLLSIYQRTAAE